MASADGCGVASYTINRRLADLCQAIVPVPWLLLNDWHVISGGGEAGHRYSALSLIVAECEAE